MKLGGRYDSFLFNPQYIMIMSLKHKLYSVIFVGILVLYVIAVSSKYFTVVCVNFQGVKVKLFLSFGLITIFGTFDITARDVITKSV